MSVYYQSIEHLYEIYGYFLNRVMRDDKIGPQMRKAGIIIKFIYTDPDGEITLDLKNEPSAGMYGSFYLGPCNLQEDVWSKQAADFSHQFWHGYVNPVAAVAQGRIRQGGKVTAMLKLLPVIKPAFRLFPVVLQEMGYQDLVLKER